MSCSPSTEFVAPTPMYDAYVVVAVASNSDSKGSVRKPEVIELCAVLVDAYAMLPISEFHSLVLPSAGPQLLPSVQSATGISSAMLGGAATFDSVQSMFLAWIAASGFSLQPDDTTGLRSCCLVAAGATDVARVLRQQCHSPEMAAPFASWTSVYKVHTMLFHRKAKTLDEARECAAARLGDRYNSALLRRGYGCPAATLSQLEVRNASYVLALQLACGALPDPCNGPDRGAERPACGFAHPSLTAAPATDTPIPLLQDSATAAAVATSGAAAVPIETQGASTDSADDVVNGLTSHDVPVALAPPLVFRSTRRSPAQDILSVESLRASIRPDEIWAATRKLVLLLRSRDVLRAGIVMTEDGFCHLDAVLAHPRLNQVHRATVAHICNLNEKQRFTLVYGADGEMYIRANFGHAADLGVVTGYTRVITAEECTGLLGVVGTNIKHWPSISRNGVNRLARPSMNLARCDTWKAANLLGDTVELVTFCKMAAGTNRGGIRCGASCFIVIDVEALIRDGGATVALVGDGTIFTTVGLDNGVIPPQYFVVVADQHGAELYRRDASTNIAAA